MNLRRFKFFFESINKVAPKKKKKKLKKKTGNIHAYIICSHVCERLMWTIVLTKRVRLKNVVYRVVI